MLPFGRRQTPPSVATVHPQPARVDESYECRWCELSFPSRRGLFVHQGHRHPGLLGDTCRIEGCDRPRERKPGGARSTLCRSHRRHPDAPVTERRTPGPADIIAYKTAHARVHKARGRAMGERCVDCGGRAQEWSFNGDLTEHIIWGPVTRHGEVWIGAWSGDPDAYEPRCKSCHHEFDLDGWRSLRWMLLGGGSEWTEELEERFRDFD